MNRAPGSTLIVWRVCATKVERGYMCFPMATSKATIAKRGLDEIGLATMRPMRRTVKRNVQRCV